MTESEAKLCRATLLSILDYNPSDGAFRWKVRRNCYGGGTLGRLAGSPLACGHIQIVIDQKKYRAHRLAWFYVHGVWPPSEVDHKNMNPADNRIDNLRLAEKWQNRANQRLRSDSTTGFKGVRAAKYGRWQANIRKHGVTKYLGAFASPEAAHAAYVKAAEEMFGEFARSA